VKHNNKTNKISDIFPPKEFLKIVLNQLYNFFQIAMGSGSNFHAPFDLNRFATAYKLHLNQTYYALQLLEKLGHIKLHDVYRHDSVVKFLLPYQELYEFQIRFPQHEPLIKLLLRSYTGILNFPVPVNEYKIATGLKKNQYDVKKQLELLHQMAFWYMNQKPNFLPLNF